jgi:hypothetical protein
VDGHPRPSRFDALTAAEEEMFRFATTMTTTLLMLVACAQLLAASAPENTGAAPKTAPVAVTSSEKEPPRLVDGWPSIDALVGDLVKALGSDDKLMLTRLQVSEDEYRNLIIPGTVEPGKPPRQNSEKVKEFFWQMLHGKSRYYRDELIERFKGHELKVKKLSFTGPTQHYAWYDAHGETRAVLEDENGKNWDLEAGYIVEVAGAFKFMSYGHDLD